MSHSPSRSHRSGDQISRSRECNKGVFITLPPLRQSSSIATYSSSGFLGGTCSLGFGRSSSVSWRAPVLQFMLAVVVSAVSAFRMLVPNNSNALILHPRFSTQSPCSVTLPPPEYSEEDCPEERQQFLARLSAT